MAASLARVELPLFRSLERLERSHFDFGAVELSTAAALRFDLTLAGLNASQLAAVLAAWKAGTLALTVQRDAPGSMPAALVLCAPGEPPVLDG